MRPSQWKISKVLKLAPERRRRLLVAIGSVTMTAAMLRLLGYSRTMERLGRWTPREPAAQPADGE